MKALGQFHLEKAKEEMDQHTIILRDEGTYESYAISKRHVHFIYSAPVIDSTVVNTIKKIKIN
jgi:hypothetical protein